MILGILELRWFGFLQSTLEPVNADKDTLKTCNPFICQYNLKLDSGIDKEINSKRGFDMQNCRKTKIMATLGPACESYEMVYELIKEGVNVFRLNFSHGKREDAIPRIENIRKASAELKVSVGIMVDLQGPKIRAGLMQNDGVTIKAGDTICLTEKEITGDKDNIYVSYPHLRDELPVGATILIDDGKIELKVSELLEDGLKCTVIVGGEVKSKKGINFPGIELQKATSLTPKDKEDLLFALQHDVDYIAISFVQRASDVLEVKEFIAEQKLGNPPVIAKIEKQEAFKNLASIVDIADGAMVARGDLGVEFPLEEVPIIQKKVIKLCNQVGKPVIIATQMLDSMIHSHRPTRAEVTDIANGIFEKADALLVTNETAVGDYPVEVVKTMAKISARTERELRFSTDMDWHAVTISQAIGRVTCELAYALRATAIITATQSGDTARQVARYRPSVPIIAATPLLKTYRELSLLWGACPVIIPQTDDTNTMISVIIQKALKEKMVEKGDTVIITAGVSSGISGTTNMVKVEVV